ncbi:unnamed protein product [Microthlaspi erraticum]|uniref:Phorbol-ester/DAG-type domain-containing protein n=1 Tax=Microthlaspi erraticum TaxID=1685480 RepID=A0A6D2KBU9_9BRAS|nr:unnamed protein product [Microthlaspi erraticum]
MNNSKLLLPIHKKLLTPWNDLRKGDCCGRKFEVVSDGYYSEETDFFAHKKCAEYSFERVSHPYHSIHPLSLASAPEISVRCTLCGMRIWDVYYSCQLCDVYMHLYCAKYPPPEVVDISDKHSHKLKLLKAWIEFTCGANCGEEGDGFPYRCGECELSFHVGCVRHTSEVNHSCHPSHPLKLFRGAPPDYTGGKCTLCGKGLEELFYHCSTCNFSVDLDCIHQPPPTHLLNLKGHGHKLTLVPRVMSFTCNGCGLKGDRSPYVCVQCNFVIHLDCFLFPRLININRHDHRVSFTPVLGVLDLVCGVCRKKMDWSCAGYSCVSCPNYAVHSTCATRDDVWNGKELEGVAEEVEDTDPYKLIEEGVIQHFSHEEHHLRLNKDGVVLYDVNKRCNACTHPIVLQSFYSCTVCDFFLHESCAQLPRKRRHVLHNDQLTLDTGNSLFECVACGVFCNGFRYVDGHKIFDLRCGSIVEPFKHPSHPQHPLFLLTEEETAICSGCNELASPVLKCIEDNCGFVLDFKCATLPQVVKHRVNAYPLSLCYGEKAKEANGKYWCEICEKETNAKTWFYTCRDHCASLHVNCVVGDLSGLVLGRPLNQDRITYEVVLSTSMTRPRCSACFRTCLYPSIMITLPGEYSCSIACTLKIWRKIFMYW